MRKFILGRSASNQQPDVIDVGASYSYVSKRHATIEIIDENRFRITDLNSTNGTEVLDNGGWRKVQSAIISGQQRFRLAGQYEATARDLAALFGLTSLPETAPDPAPLPPFPEPMAHRAPPAQPDLTVAPVASKYNGRTQDAVDLQMPRLDRSQAIDFESIRAPGEKTLSGVVFVVGLAVLAPLAVAYVLGLLVSLLALVDPYAFPNMQGIPPLVFTVTAYTLFIWFSVWFGHRWALATIEAHSLEVSPSQFPQIYAVVKQAADFLNIPVPRIFVLQGHGIFELFVSKYFSRNGYILITSNMMDEFTKRPSSREFMMFVGRQLGLIKSGYFDYKLIKGVFGKAANFFYLAWKRRCQLTADRYGLLCAGSLYPAELALLMITVGCGLAPGTNFEAVQEQSEKVRNSFFGWLHRIFSTYPPMIDRIVKLRRFATSLNLPTSAPAADRRGGYAPRLGAFPISHTTLRSVPLLIIHGHDRLALLELQNILLSRFPYVAPRVMQTEQYGALGMSEKFDRVTGDLHGAIALITPDDVASAANDRDRQAARARQNVVMEIGWVWGHLGRQRCMLLKRGDIELPSDLAGADVSSFVASPLECLPAVEAFIDHITVSLH